MMARINRTKEYEEFVFSKVYEAIAEVTGCTKEDARILLINVIAYNTVVEEILDKAKMLSADLVQEGDNPAQAVKDVAAEVRL